MTEPKTLNHSNMYARAHSQIHQSWVLGSAACAIMLGLVIPELSITLQFWLVILPITIIGLSHGGADPMILKQLACQQRKGMILATIFYMLAAAAFVVLIWYLPAMALLVFLLLSAWHFGYTDVGFTLKHSTQPLIWLSGSLSIIGPATGHPEQTGELLAWLIGADPTAFSALLTQFAPLLGGTWICAFALIAYRNRQQLPGRAIVELMLLAGVMTTLPPLLAFAYYFCVVHSIRHFMVIAHQNADRIAQRSILRFLLRKAAPATAAAIGLAVMAWLVIIALEPESSLLTAAVRVMFWSLAALTLPHAFVVALWWRHRPATPSQSPLGQK
jgi:Brp/Blh family beta-carotene 15,15'-monooxygenase